MDRTHRIHHASGALFLYHHYSTTFRFYCFDLDLCENDVTSVPQCDYPELVNDIQSGDYDLRYFIPEVYCNFIFPSGFTDSIGGIIGFELSSEQLSACKNIDFYTSNYEKLNGSSLFLADIR